jgi:minor histocompatibility antigen H13
LVPGIFVALALRFDVSRGIKNRYFNSAFLGYTVGLTVTIIVMNWFQAAQVSSVTHVYCLFAPYFCHL